MMRLLASPPIIALLTAAFVGAGLVGCAGSPSATGPAAPKLAPADAANRLAGVCPSTIVIQSAWEPDAADGPEYQLLGPGAHIDAEHKRVSGPLVIGGRDTGVTLEIRAGGSAIGFAAVPAQMFLDRSITLGNVNTDLAVATSGKTPVTTVIAPTQQSPQVLMWDPASHPDWHGIADIGTTPAAKVVVAKDSNFAALLVAKGLIRQEQVDTGYTGAPARFITDPTIAQQAFATQEPYLYEHEIAAWHKPVRYQLLADVGYNIYPETPSVRADALGPLSDCLKRLVPIMRQADLDYLNNSGPANQLIVNAVARYNDGWTYSMGVADYSAATAKQLHLAANDTSGALGGTDPTRIQSIIDTFTPILTRTGANVRPALKAADLATNQFINPTIRLP